MLLAGNNCLLKGHGDAQTPVSANIEFLHNIHIFYMSYELSMDEFLKKIRCSKVH